MTRGEDDASFAMPPSPASAASVVTSPLLSLRSFPLSLADVAWSTAAR
jgi:hypothetical protein